MTKQKIFILSAALILALSCATNRVSWQPVKTNSKLAARSNAILGLSLEVIDYTGIFPAAEYDRLPELLLGKLTGADISRFRLRKEVDYSFWDDRVEQEQWNYSDNAFHFQADFFIMTEPGEYFLDNISIQIGEIVTGDYKNSTTTTYTQHFFLNQSIIVKENSMNNLGKITLVINKAAGQWPNFDFDFSLYIDQDPDTLDNISAGMRNLNPGLYTKAITIPYTFKFFENFDSMYDIPGNNSNMAWKQTPSTATQTAETQFFYWNGKYCIKKKTEDDILNYISINKTLSLPENYTLEWKTQLKAGDTNKDYGLLFGTDQTSFYAFATTGAGQAAINLLAEQTWQNSILKYTGYPALPGSRKQEDRHKLVYREGHFRYYINDTLLCEFENLFAKAMRFIALYATTSGLVTFDDFIITEIID